jgi:hypothetical protein
VRTRKQQIIPLPPPVNPNAEDKADLEIIRAEDVKTMIAKKRQKLQESLKKGYATVYGQCSQQVRDKLKSTENWEVTQKEQLLHDLISKVEKICVGFDKHKQEVFNLVQALRALFLYMQNKKDTVEDYGQNFKSLWDTVEAFGGSPGVHKGLTDTILKAVVPAREVAMAAQVKAAEEESSKKVEAALLISGANRRHYGGLKDLLANNYLLGSDQYPDTFGKTMRILGNYQTTKVSAPYRASPNNTGVAFLQRGGRGGRGAGRGGQAGRGDKIKVGDDGGDSNDVSTITKKTGESSTKTNSKGESHCFNSGGTTHWAYKCPQLSGEQQAQLHMNLDAQEEGEGQPVEDGHQLLHVSLTQGGDLPDDRAYLDGCLTVMTFKNKRFLKEIRTVEGGIKINCNAGAVTTNKKGNFGRLNVWYLPDGIADIFSMHELKKMYRITYDSWEGFYVVHTPRGKVYFHKDEQGLPYIDLTESGHEAARMLLQMAKDTKTDDNRAVKVGANFVQMVCGNYEGCTKQEILQAKEAHRGQAMLGNPSEKDYQGLVSRNLINNCPFSSSNVSNARAIFGPDLASVRGKTVRKKPAPVVGDYVAVPRMLVEANKVITLAADVFFVDGTPFLLTVGWHLKFVTAKHVPVQTATSLSKHIKQVLEVYGRAGFRVRTILMDGEFE